jgi:XTP/dITP diphosphohydrolase
MTRILLATTNPGKIREIRELLGGLPIELSGLNDWPSIVPPEETGTTFAENARLKAVYYADATGVPALAEDSGLEIDALDGAPGVHSARYGGAATTYPEKFAMIYAALRQRGAATSTARFVCAAALASDGRVLFETRGTVEGTIATAPSGTGGFGYDPIFYYPPFGLTLAEVPQAQKASVSHRGAALREVRRFLESRNDKPLTS